MCFLSAFHEYAFLEYAEQWLTRFHDVISAPICDLGTHLLIPELISLLVILFSTSYRIYGTDGYKAIHHVLNKHEGLSFKYFIVENIFLSNQS